MHLMKISRCLVLSFGLCGALPALAADEAQQPALRRGVSLSNWFAESQNAALAAGDFRRIKDAGFDHVRIPVDPELLGFSLFDADRRVLFDFAKLDGAVNMARDIGLAAIIEVQPTESFLTQVEQEPRAEAAFIGFWRTVAEHYRLYAPGTLAFEILDAPGYTADAGKYRLMVLDAVGAIHQAMPAVTIIVDLPKSATLQGFEGFSGVDEPNIVYGFHFYEPFLFTHQGLKGPAVYGYALRSFHDLPYPSSLADPKTDYAPLADPLEVKRDVLEYNTAGWDAGHIAARIKLAADWAKANQRRVLCTEFGVVRKTAAPDSRYRWIADTRKALEAQNIGWDVWDYADTFAITTPGDAAADPDSEDALRRIEPHAVDALFK
jgi:endoglucanase